MAYIVFVNPAIPSDAGMDKAALITVTILAVTGVRKYIAEAIPKELSVASAAGIAAGARTGLASVD